MKPIKLLYCELQSAKDDNESFEDKKKSLKRRNEFLEYMIKEKFHKKNNNMQVSQIDKIIDDAVNLFIKKQLYS